MKILFIIPVYKPAYIYGGLMAVVYLLAESLVRNGHDVTVYTTTANGKEELNVKTDEEVLVDGVKVYYFKRYTKGNSHLSPGFWNKIFQTVKDFDVVHLHSWWSPAIVAAAAVCRMRGVKPILSPHGMFCDYILTTNNKVKKQILQTVVGKSLLKNTFLHVSTPMEWEESQLILKDKWDGAIISNLVELDNIKPPATKETNSVFTVGFISRIDPKKGLDILIKALSKVSFDYKLKVAGTGEDDYVNKLKTLAIECGNADKIEWVGWKDNVQKMKFYSEIDLFALTSHNENFAVVVIESLSVGTPVFLGKNVGLSSYVAEKQLGWITNIHDTDQVAADLEIAYRESDKRNFIYENAPAIISHDFDKNLLTKQYTDYYKTLMPQ